MRNRMHERRRVGEITALSVDSAVMNTMNLYRHNDRMTGVEFNSLGMLVKLFSFRKKHARR